MSTLIYYKNSKERAYLINTIYAYCSDNKIDYSQGEQTNTSTTELDLLYKPSNDDALVIDLMYSKDESNFEGLLEMLSNNGYTIDKCPTYKK